jgi:hypothetical protein
MGSLTYLPLGKVSSGYSVSARAFAGEAGRSTREGFGLGDWGAGSCDRNIGIIKMRAGANMDNKVGDKPSSI